MYVLVVISNEFRCDRQHIRKQAWSGLLIIYIIVCIANYHSLSQLATDS